MNSKSVVIKLFFNRSDRTFYIQIGGTLFRVNDKVATRIQNSENLSIRHGTDIKNIQQISREDDDIM